MNGEPFDCSFSSIVIIGPRTLQNEFLLYVLRKELGCLCMLLDGNDPSLRTVPETDDSVKSMKKLIMIDTEHESFEAIITHIVADVNLTKCYISLFNLSANEGIEKRALSQNIRGFFYKEDRFEVFLKGIKTILSGEVWISREILLKCVFDGFKEKQTASEEKINLTTRELEMLSFVSMGFSNVEIAKKTFISMNTVKTHLYRIFKKIGVENRLQAALWAATNM